MLYELTCAECNLPFSAAASLLKHFAEHASQVTAHREENKTRSIPDLYPISSLKSFKQSKVSEEDPEENVDSGVEDVVNPLRYCTVSMEDLPVDNEYTCNGDKLKNRIPRKYKCTYCTKTFGWSTDLKRHTLTHTGERPFKCTLCSSTFTRKFLLQKHEAKQHNDGYCCSSVLGNAKIPALKPIDLLFERKSRKQDKRKIKRKVLDAKNLYQSEHEECEVADDLLFLT